MGIETGSHEVIDLTQHAAPQIEAAKFVASLVTRNGAQVKLRANEPGNGFYYGGSYFTEDDEVNRARMTDTENPLPPYHQAMYENYYGQPVGAGERVVDNVRNIFERTSKEGEQ